MLIAITGASGFIGGHLASGFMKKNVKVRLLIHQHEVALEGEKYRGSLADVASLKRFLQGVDILFHLASALGGCNLSEKEFFAINDVGTSNLMSAAADRGVKKVVHFSSAGVYGRSTGLVPLQETDETNPRDRYEKSKLAGERTALSYAERIDVSVIRPGWVYGEGDSRTFRLIRRICKGPFFIAGSGRVMHSTIHVSDVTRLSMLVAEKGKRGEVYNSGGENLAVTEIVYGIAAALGKNKSFFKLPIPLVLPAALCAKSFFSFLGKEAPLTPAMLAFFRRGKPLDGRKAETELDFVPRVRFADGMRRTVEWYRENGWL